MAACPLACLPPGLLFSFPKKAELGRIARQVNLGLGWAEEGWAGVQGEWAEGSGILALALGQARLCSGHPFSHL